MPRTKSESTSTFAVGDQVKLKPRALRSDILSSPWVGKVVAVEQRAYGPVAQVEWAIAYPSQELHPEWLELDAPRLSPRGRGRPKGG
jgi:hypothetical protein